MFCTAFADERFHAQASENFSRGLAAVGVGVDVLGSGFRPTWSASNFRKVFFAYEKDLTVVAAVCTGKSNRQRHAVTVYDGRVFRSWLPLIT